VRERAGVRVPTFVTVCRTTKLTVRRRIMIKKVLLGGVCLGFVMCAGCAMVASPLPGSIYTSVSYPSYYHGVDNGGPGTKRGEAMASSILGIVATGDASIEAAARNGRITKIHTADTKATSILGVYATYTTVVTGE
jgi:hypothetical protein